MTVNLGSRPFKIVSLTDGNPPVGIDNTLPVFQIVRVDRPVQWELKNVGNNIYRLSAGGYPYTGIRDNKVIASINPEDELDWQFLYREGQDAYTIAAAEDPKCGWTVLPDSPDIAIKPIVSTPPQFLLSQLFKFEPVDD